MPVMLVMLPVMPAMPVVMAKINQTLLSMVRPTIYQAHRNSKENCSHKTIDQDNHTPWTYQHFVIN